MKSNGKDTQTKISRAWLLDFGRGLRASVGFHEMSQVLIAPTLFDVPCTPLYCNEVLIFQDHILPVLDFPSFLEGHKVPHLGPAIVGIVVHQEDLNHPLSYAGLRLVSLPINIYVSDDQACELSFRQEHWHPPLVVSCFAYEETIIPVLNLVYLFSKKVGTYTI